ncbi:ATP-binding protein [Thiosulfatihalobacter marinus]|uniref:ATP-binding protein n=1 Tax=Thiosulfatihalobacter marinus TaxID=2792481 RepID=UPI0018D792A6|nr:ATP-binding protein [Thiosulfatihalobacter marinus]
MGAEILEIDRRLSRFDQRNTPAGLLCRYAAGRVKHFLSRQVLTLSGAVSLVVLASPSVGLVAVALALLGEAVDCLFLRHVPARLENGVPFRRLWIASTMTAVFQSATIGACVYLAWFTAPGNSGMFFSLAYATGAAINGGIVLPFHKGAALGRLAVYAMTLLGLFMYEFTGSSTTTSELSYNVFGAAIMAYMVWVFISYVRSGHNRETANSRNLLAQGLQLAKANSSMNAQQTELRRLALVAQRALDSVIVSDVKGRILWVNDAFTRITGFAPEEVLGRRPASILNGPDTSEKTSDEIAHAIREGRTHRTEIINYTKDGRRIWVETNLAPVFDACGNMEMVIAIERDVTLAKQHQEELAQAKRAAEEGERAKADFLASMSHEIRTPMNGIIGMADLLSDMELSGDSRLYVNTIRHSAEALLTIINDILDFSKLRAGKMRLNPVVFDLSECLRNVTDLLRPQASGKGLYLELGPADLPGIVRGDDVRLRQILLNVIGNAIKFTERGGVTVRVSTDQTPDDILCRIDVADTGIGIPADRLDHVFEQFAQADAATTRRFGGTGLGLSISRKLAQNMGGDIVVTSTPGAGSCFSITIRLHTARAENGAQGGPSENASPSALKGLTVLLAEDNKTNRLVIAKFLRDAPITLKSAHDGRQAVDMAARLNPDVILMDMSMPEMDGLDATRAIRALPGPQPRIIALTANAYHSDREACLEAGMDAFLTKPVRKAQLIQQIAQLARHKAD